MWSGTTVSLAVKELHNLTARQVDQHVVEEVEPPVLLSSSADTPLHA